MKKALAKPQSPSAAKLRRDRRAARQSLDAEILGRLIGGMTVIRRTPPIYPPIDDERNPTGPTFSREPLYLRNLSDDALVVLTSCERRLRADGDIVVGGQVFYPLKSTRLAHPRRIRLPTTPAIVGLSAAEWLEACAKAAHDTQASINALDAIDRDQLLSMGIELRSDRTLFVDYAGISARTGLSPRFIHYYFLAVLDDAAREALTQPLRDAEAKAERERRDAADAAYNRLCAWRKSDAPSYPEMKGDMDIVMTYSHRPSKWWRWPSSTNSRHGARADITSLDSDLGAPQAAPI
jgi:hypothetical protein